MRRIGEHESLFLRLFLRDRVLAEQKLRTVGLARDDRIDDGVVLQFGRGPRSATVRAAIPSSKATRGRLRARARRERARREESLNTLKVVVWDPN